MRVEVSTLGGVLLGVLALVMGFVWEGGRAGALLEGTAALIVFGGTIGATIVSFSSQEIRQIPRYFAWGFKAAPFDAVALIDRLCEYNDTFRKAGLKDFEARVAREPDRFLQKGLQLVADGKNPEEIRQQLEVEVWAEQEAIQQGARLFGLAGGYAPTMGIAGTVMGLIHVLTELGGSAAALGQAIGLAFIATLYGVGSANLLWLPLSSNLKNKAGQILVQRQIALDGLDLIARRTTSNLDLRPRLLGHIEARLQTAAAESGDKAPTPAAARPRRR